MALPADLRLSTHTIYHGVAWWGMAVLAVVLLSLCSLLAGLTLALSGLDTTRFRLTSVTGTPRQKQQVIVVGKIKSHSTWMLCSLIICSCACGEALPFVIQSLWHGSHQWAPILLSTFSIALFGEILPQYTIPRHAIAWGYYCSPLIWGCMWSTGVISYPLARLLDTIARCKAVHGLFTNEEMAAIIKYHEQSENNGGMIGPDAARVMLGALRLDSQKVGGDIAMIPYKGTEDEKDVEKADPIILHGLIVHWPGVRTVDINEVVDETFITKINSWSYSRLPVIGDPKSYDIQGDHAATNYRWRGKQIFGFLHVKNLVGLEIENRDNSKSKIITVRDLPLYPLPIIHEDMSVYDLLSIFQLGISRMAIVVPMPFTISQSTLKAPLDDLTAFQSLRWTAPEWTQNIRRTDDASTDQTVGSSVDTSARHNQEFTGVTSPKPIGIVTFEDIVDAILQKTSRDESDFFNRGNVPPPTKSKKAADYTKFLCSYVRDRYRIPFSPRKTAAFRPSIPTTLRRRNISSRMQQLSNICAIDGVDELSIDNASVTTTQLCTDQNNNNGNSYLRDSSSSANEGDGLSQIEGHERLSFQVKTESLPSRRAIAAVLPGGSTPFWRHVSAAPRLPQLQRVTPFSRQNYSSYEITAKNKAKASDPASKNISGLPSPGHLDQHEPQSNATGSGTNDDEELEGITTPGNVVDSMHEGSREALSLVSWCPAGFVDVDEWNAQIDNSSIVTRKPMEGSRTSAVSLETMRKENVLNTEHYEGFPPELLTNTRKENFFPSRPSSTLPRMNSQGMGIHGQSIGNDNLSQPREDGFHDDKALSNSQRKPINNTAVMAIGGARSSSFWI